MDPTHTHPQLTEKVLANTHIIATYLLKILSYTEGRGQHCH